MVHGRIVDPFENPNRAATLVDALGRLGLTVAAAGELAIAYGILPWEPGSVAPAAGRLLADWITARGHLGPAEIALGLAQVRKFLAQYGDSRFAPLDDPGSLIPNRAGFRRGDGEDREWLIPPEIWHGEVATGFDGGALARALAGRGMMKLGRDGKPQVMERTPLGKPSRHYVVNARVFEELGDA